MSAAPRCPPSGWCVLFVVLLVGCSKEPAQHVESGAIRSPTPSLEADDDRALDLGDFKLWTVETRSVEGHLHVAGEVLDNAYGTTLITPRIPALVIARHARLGDDVDAGAPLVTLSSPEVADATATLQLAEQEWQRIHALGRDLVSGRRFSEAQVVVEQARAKARALGLPGTAVGRTNGEFTLTAPHAGRITEDAFVVGQQIDPGYVLFRLVDESTVWVDAHLPSGAAGQIQVGSAASIVVGNERLDSTVLLRGHRTAEDTRTALVRLAVPNPKDRLHAGDLVQVVVTLEHAPEPKLLVPSAALTLLRGQTVAFRLNSEGSLDPVPVEVGETIDTDTVVSAGLQAGDQIATAGIYELKSRLLRSELGDDD